MHILRLDFPRLSKWGRKLKLERQSRRRINYVIALKERTARQTIQTQLNGRRKKQMCHVCFAMDKEIIERGDA
jgi:hypothetical protein